MGIKENKNNSLFSKSSKFIGRFIDIPSALAGSVIMGLIVSIINSGYGFWPATTAALKQAAYTFLLGGLIIKFLYFGVATIPGKTASLLVSVLVTSVITIFLVYLVHSLKGTPMPFESTLPTILLAPPGFLWLAWRRRKVISR